MIWSSENFVVLYGGVTGIQVVRGEGSREISSSANFDSKNFGKIVNSRGGIILSRLMENKTVFYTDVDALWMKSPFELLENYSPYDMVIADDSQWSSYEKHTHTGPSKRILCTGFMFFRPEASSKALLREWVRILSRKNPTWNQGSFNEAVRNLPRKYQEKIGVFDVLQFPPGWLYWSKKLSEKKKKGVYMVHNNWIVGKVKKLRRFNESGLWVVPEGMF